MVDYRAEWPALFRAEQQRLVQALGPTARRVDHIGSTAVPGLTAKSPLIAEISTRAESWARATGWAVRA